MDTPYRSPSEANPPPAPDDVPTAVGAMCGACGAGRYVTGARHPGRVVCNRCGNGRPLG